MAPTSPGVTQTLSLICISEVAREGQYREFYRSSGCKYQMGEAFWCLKIKYFLCINIDKNNWQSEWDKGNLMEPRLILFMPFFLTTRNMGIITFIPTNIEIVEITDLHVRDYYG